MRKAYFDALGNIRQRTEGSRSVAITYNAANQVATVTDSAVAGGAKTWTHDVRGNVTTNGRTTFAWDDANQPNTMTGAGAATHIYDGRQKRVKTNAGGDITYSIYPSAGGSVSLQHRPAANEKAEYITIGPVTVRLTNGANPVYTFENYQGSTVAAVNANGAVAWRESYTPFGEALTKPAANDNRRGFTGHVGDGASNLVYMQARYFDPAVGRFLSTDPVGYQDQLNLYAYVHNDPIGNVDPDGTQTAPGSMDPETTLRVMEANAAAGHAVVQTVRDDPGILLDVAAIVIDVIDIPSGESAAMIAARRAARAASQASEPTAIIYLRRNPNTGREYVGRTRDNETYRQRQAAHNRARGVKHEYEVIDPPVPVSRQRQREQDEIDRRGGPTNGSNPNGGLENRRNKIRQRAPPTGTRTRRPR